MFEGQTITTNAMLLRLTYMDDMNMFGDMSPQDAASDALLFAANYGTGTTWSVGDLTHDGVINSQDGAFLRRELRRGSTVIGWHNRRGGRSWIGGRVGRRRSGRSGAGQRGAGRSGGIGRLGDGGSLVAAAPTGRGSS